MISVIIPVLNEERYLPCTLAALQQQRGDFETIVVDGGSSDLTCWIAAAEAGVTVISSRRGRAEQMNAGARIARGELLLFLHADTTLPAHAIAALQALSSNPLCVWGGFRHAFSGNDWRLRLISRLHNWRCGVSRIFYGDQAMFVRAGAIHHVGGFPPVPILEDVAISEILLAVSAPTMLDNHVVTDARKFVKMGIWRSLGRVVAIMLCYRLRLPIPMRAFFAPIR